MGLRIYLFNNFTLTIACSRTRQSRAADAGVMGPANHSEGNVLAAAATHSFVAIEVYLPENTKKVYIFSSVEKHSPEDSL